MIIETLARVEGHEETTEFAPGVTIEVRRAL